MTPQQLDVLDYARELITAGLSPSVRDVAEQFFLPMSAARSTIDALIDAGSLRRGPGRTNNLLLAEQPDVHATPTTALVAELRRRGLGGSVPMRQSSDPRAWRRGFHPCAIHSCSRSIAADKVMCGSHWFALPIDLRRGLRRTSAAGESARFDALVATARSLIETGARA